MAVKFISMQIYLKVFMQARGTLDYTPSVQDWSHSVWLSSTAIFQQLAVKEARSWAALGMAGRYEPAHESFRDSTITSRFALTAKLGKTPIRIMQSLQFWAYEERRQPPPPPPPIIAGIIVNCG
jgi:hypothetical protein